MMKDRILEVMKKKQMSQKTFAETLGIAPSSLSSLLNGRTAPTNNQVQAIHRCFPEISVSWLMFGEGEMVEFAPQQSPIAPQHSPVSSSQVFQGDLFNQNNTQEVVQAAPPSNSPHIIEREIVKFTDKPQRRITEIHVYYDDGTFERFTGLRD